MYRFIQVVSLAFLFALVGVNTTQAVASTVVIDSVGAQSSAAEYGTAEDVTFDISASGGGGDTSVTWSVSSALPTGVTANFSDTVSIGAGPWTTTLTLSSDTTAEPDAYSVTVTATGDISGSDDETFTYTISPRSISAAGLTADDREYDGTTDVTLSGSLTDVINGDDVTAQGTFSTKDAEDNKTVTITLTGADASKYITSDTLTASISKKDVTLVSGDFATNGRPYDGTTEAELRGSPNGLILSGVIAPDDVTVTGGTGEFADKHVGSGKTVTFSGFTTGGTDGGNYNLLNQPANETQNINIRNITVRPVNDSKVYDGTTDSSLEPTVTSGSLAAGDTSLFTQAYANATVGTGKTIVSSGVVDDGNGGGNYVVTHNPRTNSEITPLELTVTGLSANTKFYDKTTTATLAAGGSLVGIINSDDVTPVFSGATGDFDTADAGTGKSVTVSGITLAGVDAFNYTVAQPVVEGTILPRPISVTAVTASKVYDGDTVAAGTPYLSSGTLVSGDTAIYTQEFETKDAGIGKTINPIAAITDGNGGANYEVTAVTNTTGEISPRALLVTAVGDNKTYDGTTDATVSFSDDRLGSDDIEITGDADFDTKHIGVGKVITVTGIALSGNDAGNYTPNTSTVTSGDVTVATLTVTIVGDDKVYDGTREATITVFDDHIEGDDVTVLYPTTGADRPRFGNRNVGPSKNVTVAGLTLTGADAGNYTLAATTVVDTAVAITPAPVTVTYEADDKVYDNTTDTNVHSPVVTTVLFGADDVAVSVDSTGDFEDSDAGEGKEVSATGLTLEGTHADNYFIDTVIPATADITLRDLEIGATAEDKVYDGTVDATVEYSDNRISDDDITVTGDATFADKHVGEEKTVTVINIALSGDDAGNYTYNTDTVTTADITERELTITATGVNKVYDTTTDADVVLDDNRVEGDDLIITWDAAFEDKHVGTEKEVSVTNLLVSGDDAGNYSANTDTTTSADITPRPLAVTATGVDKRYDGTTAATVILADDRLEGDDLTATGTASFADADAGEDKLVTVTDIELSGPDALNYEANETTTTVASITRSSSNSGSRGARRSVGTVLGESTTTIPSSNGSTTLPYQFLFDLTMGMANADVTMLQQVLMAKGYLQIPATTGYFGPLTLAAVKEYQAAHGIITTGYVGPLTRGALNQGL